MPQKNKAFPNSYLTGILTGILASFLFFVLIPQLLIKNSVSISSLKIPFQKATPTPDAKTQSEQLTKQVLPEKYDLEISFGQTIKKLVETGAIDKQKFLDLYQDRGGLPEEFKKLLDIESNKKIIATADNSAILLNLLWPLGIANKTKILADGPMTKDFANYASTGGWTLGKEEGGKLFNRFSILPLTPEQENTVIEISQNIYRPCCGNSTYFPDCNHGAAMLGYIELAVTQGLSKDKIYKNALVLNSYWFPQTYVEMATFFKSKDGTEWEKIDPKIALSAQYSSGQGYASINKELQTQGLIPKVEGGGGCGI